MSQGLRPRPLRALLYAHFLGATQPLRRGRGRVAIGLLIALYALLAALPMVVGLGLLGTQVAVGGAARQESMNATIAFALSLYVLANGLAGGMDGTSRQLSWETLRVFPVTTRTLFAAELCASAIGLVRLPALLGLFTFCVVASVIDPRSTGLFLVLFASHALLLLALHLLFASLLQRASRSLRATLVVVPSAALLALFAAVSLLERLSETTLGQVTALLRRAVQLLPSHAVLAAASALRRGHARADVVLLGVLAPLAVAAGMLWIAHWVVARETPLAPRVRARPARLWTFGRPVWGVARLQLMTVLSSIPGRFAFALPLVTLPFFRMPFMRDLGSHWPAACAFLYASFATCGLLANQFGLDRHGVKVLLLLPIDERTLLRGKLLGYGLWSAMQSLVLVALLALLRSGSVESIAVGVAVHGAMFVLQSMAGTPLSIAHSVPVRADRIQQGRGRSASLVGLLVFPAYLISAALVAAVLAATAYWAPGWELPVMAATFIALVGVQQATVPLGARYLVRHREKLVEQLGGAA